MSASEAVDNPAAVSAPDYQAGKPKLGQVLAGDRGPATGDGGQGCNVQVLVTQRPQHPDPCGVGQEREGEHRRVDRRNYSPILRQADLPTTEVPWRGGRQLSYGNR